ncbi:MAG TPA: DUF2501 domain-containing protein [Candidatus Accumulibacter phosphatis]|nr:MAG: hypothetical protein AW07_02597 [Candidatus Accumulibacter sp. SK-11]HRL76751.1 DUF2501 domain-containing protein [Candidatus Accumulibacter phosphatis]HRQ96983.1 DUF2501 domain-containing protein [Candidatus Accumulibacter phosphatis]
MKTNRCRSTVAVILAAALLPLPVAQAQLGDLLQQGEGSGLPAGLGGVGGLSGALPGQSLTAGSVGNVAGLLEFCIRNNYLGGKTAASVKDSLTGRLPGGSPRADPGYDSGSRGILNSRDGGELDLGAGGFKKQVTKQICDRILAQGKSLL